MRRWQSSRSRLSLSLKGGKAQPVASECSENGAIPPPIPPLQKIVEVPVTGGILKASHLGKWHQEVEKRHKVLDSVLTGHPSSELLLVELLKQPTEEYLATWDRELARPSIELDSILGEMINEHTQTNPLTKDVAVLACLAQLTTSAASQHLVTLMGVNLKRYLRCITLAGHINPNLLSQKEVGSARIMLSMISSPTHEFERLNKLVEILGWDGSVTLMPFAMVQKAIRISGIASRLQPQVVSCLERHHYLSLFDLTSWLQHMPKGRDNHNVITLLDECLPSWRWLKEWRPNIDRISRWEQGIFSDLQRKKLSSLFKLDGPDVATHRQQSLKLAEPMCYSDVLLDPQNLQTLERLLDLLYEAESIGKGALEFFIHLCVDNTANESSLSMADVALLANDDSHCKDLALLFQALDPRYKLDAQIRALNRALPMFNGKSTPIAIPRTLDYYAILRVSNIASYEEIKKSYRKLALDLHPDKNRLNPNATADFQKLVEAYETVGDSTKRRHYDIKWPRIRGRVQREQDADVAKKIRVAMNNLACRLGEVIKAAQEVFCAQLKTGTGEYLGMLIFELGSAIKEASGIHAHLPGSFLAQLQQLPPLDVLEAIFSQLEDSQNSSSPQDVRFKSYVAAALGGNGEYETGSMNLVGLQKEIEFWKHPLDATRRDFVKKIGGIRCVDYALYTSCILASLEEETLYLNEINALITKEDGQTCIKFATYLAHRRGLKRMQHECWLLLLSALLRAQGSDFLRLMAESTHSGEWIKFADSLVDLIAPVLSQLPLSGAGLTRDQLSLWRILSQYKPAVKFLLKGQRKERSISSLYFPPPGHHIEDLLNISEKGEKMMPLPRQIIQELLASDLSNAETVCDCCNKISHSSPLCIAVCERILAKRTSNGNLVWSNSELSIVIGAWLQSKDLKQLDKIAIDCLQRLLGIPVASHLPSRLQQNLPSIVKERYDLEYRTAIQDARDLETLRLKLQRQNPKRISTLLQRVGVESQSTGRALDSRIPDELVDVVESVGESEYELAYALTGLKSLQRQARGIPKESRMLLIRLRFQGRAQFCIHFSSDNEFTGRHTYYSPTDRILCTNKPTLFAYFLSNQLTYLLRANNFSWKTFHSTILTFMAAPPTTCLACPNPIGIKLWKPTTCSPNCSSSLKSAPLEVRLHNLLVDPTSTDLLLTCIYEAAGELSTLDLLPGCPVRNNIRAVIDSLPPLASLQTASNLKAAIQGADSLGHDRELLLSWLYLTFRGFILNAQSIQHGVIPSMPNTHQFLLLNSHHEREQLFNAKLALQGNSRTVFHGTRPSRLFRILTEGLKVMSGTPGMQLNGASYGAGIYCGEDQATSNPYAGTTGKSWKHSKLGNMKVMLGCELVHTVPPPITRGSIHVIADEHSLLVRYVFLLPPNYHPPPRHHVEPAMNIVFANLRSGTLA